METLRGGAQWKEVRSLRGVPLSGILELKPLLPLSFSKEYFIILCVCVYPGSPGEVFECVKLGLQSINDELPDVGAGNQTQVL